MFLKINDTLLNFDYIESVTIELIDPENQLFQLRAWFPGSVDDWHVIDEGSQKDMQDKLARLEAELKS